MNNSRFAGLPVLGYERSFVAGLDLGQKQDHTAVALIERTVIVYDARDPVSYSYHHDVECRLVHAERLPLGLPYTAVVERVARLMEKAPAGETPSLVVDATGVGAPVVDLFQARGLPGRMIPVIITSGDSARDDGDVWRVPKRDLITGLQLAFETRALLIDAGVTAAEILISELMSMRATVTARGHERIESWRDGSHDDLVLATALAWWHMFASRTVTPSWLLRRGGTLFTIDMVPPEPRPVSIIPF